MKFKIFNGIASAALCFFASFIAMESSKSASSHFSLYVLMGCGIGAILYSFYAYVKYKDFDSSRELEKKSSSKKKYQQVKSRRLATQKRHMEANLKLGRVEINSTHFGDNTSTVVGA